ncbi:MAG: potassium channel family protein [Reyranella sp.]
MRRFFFGALFRMLGIVWPILSGVLLVMIGPGLAIGVLEGWSVGDSFYFTFVTGLTIGYGDLVPHRAISRVLAAVIGLAGILLTGLVAAVIVQALQETARDSRARR